MKINSTDFLPNQQTPEQVRFIPTYLENQCQCQLCAYDYDLGQRVPMMLCQSQHNCCLVCVKQIIIRKKECPFCRKTISLEGILKNRMLCKILEQVARKKGIQIKINQNPEKQFIKNRNSLVFNQDVAPDVNIYENDLNNYHALINLLAEPQNQTCCQKIWNRIELKEPLYCIAYFLIMVYSLPFFICQLTYALSKEQFKCMDTDYGVGMSLRSWLFSSSLIGISTYSLQFLIILFKIILPQGKRCANALTIFNIILFLLKFLGYNIVGFVIWGNIDQDGLSDCNGSVLAYMEALFIIQIVIVCGLCSLTQRRRR